MRVAHVTATFPPYLAGTGNVCYYSARELARLGHDVTVFTSSHGFGPFDSPADVRVCRLPTPLRLGNAPLVPGLLKVGGFDLIHLHLPFIFGSELTWLNARIRGIPYVCTYHNDLIGFSYRRPLFYVYQASILRLVIRDAARFLPTTVDYVRASRIGGLIQQLGDRVVEVPNGVDTVLFQPDIDCRTLQSLYGLDNEDSIVLFVGALDRAHHFKGVGILFKALARLKDDRVKALVVGGGELLDYYRRQAQRLGVGDRVIFVGQVPQKELPRYYALCKCLVLPSTSTESWGIVLLEAMACGKPVVASSLPGVRAVVNDGVDGLLVQPASVADLQCKLEMLLADATLRSDMGQQGRAKVEEKYTWQKIARRLEHVYHDVLSGNR